ncbi:hypothetical protein [Enterococcus crotali]
MSIRSRGSVQIADNCSTRIAQSTALFILVKEGIEVGSEVFTPRTK